MYLHTLLQYIKLSAISLSASREAPTDAWLFLFSHMNILMHWNEISKSRNIQIEEIIIQQYFISILKI